MNASNYIEKKQLPLALDYKSLQEKGRTFIQEHSTNAWTNLNPSDPGVTILEQLCYAMTELGYCTDFPIEDILTEKDNGITIDNQFYLPKDILTIAPITVQDYIKFLIDKVEGLKNVVTKTLTVPLIQVKGVYQSFIVLDDSKGYENPANPICNAALYELNSARNLGEYFFEPSLITLIKYEVHGDLEIKSDYELNDVLKTIQYQINNYIFPQVTQTGYDNLKNQGQATNTIFNGPILSNGWIPNTSIKAKKNTIKSFEITQIIETIPGVQSISNLSFYSEESGYENEISSTDEQLIHLDILNPSKEKDLNVIQNGGVKIKDLNITYIEDLIEMQQPQSQLDSIAAVNMSPKIPEGDYRDIATYYSVQNTFPQSYGLGINGLKSNLSNFQIAQSKQLKGYLTLYDQVLINQFSQLASLGQLFSFKNSDSGAPYDEQEFYNKQTEVQKLHQEFPAPFKTFSPTYYYQSLYNASADIETLLKNYKAFRYSYGLENPKNLDKKGWDRYKNSPYNSYIWGLMDYMEDEEINLLRRNDILNHLLARHGESPEIIDAIIGSSAYAGNREKSLVVVKSLILQNLQILSYNKNKAYNYLGADLLLPQLDEDYDLFLLKLLVSNGYKKPFKDLEKNENAKVEEKATELLEEFTDSSQSDFIIDIDRIDAREKISPFDTINYATIELKLALLFSLQEYYRFEIGGHWPKKKARTKQTGEQLYQQKRDLLWMITKRKGLLLIETNLLIHPARFRLKKGNDFLIHKPEGSKDLSYDQLIDAFQDINEDCEHHNIDAVWGENNQKSLKGKLLSHTLILIFPKFLETDDFKNRIDFFLKNDLPPQLSYTLLFVSDSELNELIPIYINWYNSQIYIDESSVFLPEIVVDTPEVTSWNLVCELERIIKKRHD